MAKTPLQMTVPDTSDLSFQVTNSEGVQVDATFDEIIAGYLASKNQSNVTSQELATLQAALTAAEAKSSETTKALTAAGNDLSTANAKLTDFANQINALKSDLANAKQGEAAAQQAFTDLKAKLQALLA